MSRYNFILVVAGFLVSNAAFGAELAVCRISDSIYEEFQPIVGAEISIDLKTGHNQISLNGKTLSLIGKDVVSTHRADAKTCEPTKVEETKNESAATTMITFSFSNCASDSSIVHVVEGINFESKRGMYIEGSSSELPRAPRFFFDNCVIR